MSALTDFIAAYPPEELAKALQADPAFRVFNLLWQEPQQIAPACEAMGLQTPEDVIAWAAATSAAIGNTAAFESLIDPSPAVDYDALMAVPFSVIHAAITSQCNLRGALRDDFCLSQSDATYRAMPLDQLTSLAAQCPARKAKWRADRMDCDDFVKAFLGWLASKGLGNLAIGSCVTTAYRAGAVIGGHALVIALDSAGKVWLIEPQSGLLYEPKSIQAARLGGFWLADEMKLAKVDF